MLVVGIENDTLNQIQLLTIMKYSRFMYKMKIKGVKPLFLPVESM